MSSVPVKELATSLNMKRKSEGVDNLGFEDNSAEENGSVEVDGDDSGVPRTSSSSSPPSPSTTSSDSSRSSTRSSLSMHMTPEQQHEDFDGNTRMTLSRPYTQLYAGEFRESVFFLEISHCRHCGLTGIQHAQQRYPEQLATVLRDLAASEREKQAGGDGTDAEQVQAAAAVESPQGGQVGQEQVDKEVEMAEEAMEEPPEAAVEAIESPTEQTKSNNSGYEASEEMTSDDERRESQFEREHLY